MRISPLWVQVERSQEAVRQQLPLLLLLMLLLRPQLPQVWRQAVQPLLMQLPLVLLQVVIPVMYHSRVSQPARFQLELLRLT
jgi:hypothetical protein